MPERTCVATREKADQKDLIRLIRAPDGQILVDYRGRLTGRGAWVKPELRALERLQDRPRILGKVLRGPVQVAGLVEQVQAANLSAVLQSLSLAARSGSLVGGGERVRGALKSDRACALILASDASPRGSADLSRRARNLPVVTLPLDRDALGAQIGRGSRAALVVMRGKAGNYLLRELQRWTALR
jgi:predicted RNA-binding protein YlxR (DUF448 family)